MDMEQPRAGNHIFDIDDEPETGKKEDAQESPMPDMEKIEVEQLTEYLGVNPAQGLSSEEAAHRLKAYGPNVLEMPNEEDTESWRWVSKICFCFKWDQVILEDEHMMLLILNPVSWAMFFAAIITATLYAVGGDRIYLYDSLVITFLLLLNCTLCNVAMRRVRIDKAPLIGVLKPKTKVMRDGKWREEDPTNLVRGDIIFLKTGDIVPAEVRIFDDSSVEIMNSGLYSRGLYRKIVNYQESVVCGEGIAVVTNTGQNMSTENVTPNHFGRAGQLRRAVFAAGYFCFLAVIIGTCIELVVVGCDDNLILFIGGLPMALPAVFCLCLSCGCRKLSQLGIASRGTTGLENLASIDTVFFNITGTLTLNHPEFDENLIYKCDGDMNVKDAILVAARTNPRQCDLHREPIDAAIFNMLSNPIEAISGIEEEIKYFPYDYFRKWSYRSFLHKEGRYCCAIKGEPEQVMWTCHEVSVETEKDIIKRVEGFGRKNYESLAIAFEDSDKTKLVALMPYKDELREDSVKTIETLTEMGMRVIILTASESPRKKNICVKLGMPERDVHNYRTCINKLSDGLLSKANLMAITCAYRGVKEDIVNYAVTEMDYRCAVVGGGRHDTGALKQSHVAIASPVASDKAKALSDLVLTGDDLSPFVKSAQISRVASALMANYIIYAVSSTVYVFGILVIPHIRTDIFSCFLVLVMAFFNYGFGFAFLGESRKVQSPVIWRVRNMVTTGLLFGCYLCFTTAIFLSSLNSFHDVLDVRSLNDDEKKAALFLQVSIANQAIVFLQRCRLVDYPGHSIFGAFSLFQMAATLISVYGGMGLDGVKGIGWGWAGVIWMYNCLFMLGLGVIKFITCTFVENACSWIRLKGPPNLISYSLAALISTFHYSRAVAAYMLRWKAYIYASKMH